MNHAYDESGKGSGDDGPKTSNSYMEMPHQDLVKS
jgi:hypothetical protein